jgi:hypothetical protein
MSVAAVPRGSSVLLRQSGVSVSGEGSVPEPVSSPPPDDRREDLRAVFAPKRAGPGEGDLDKLRGAISEAAGLLRTYTVGYLTVALYLVVTAANTTHQQLLIGKEITLPIVNVGVPLVGFYILAPVVFVALHSNLLFHLEALALRLQSFGEHAARLDEAARRRARLLLVPFQFVDWHVRSDEIGLDRAFYGVAAWLLYFASGPAALLMMQLSFLPYQHDLVTPWHVLCVAAATASAWRFSRMLGGLSRTAAAKPSRWPGRFARASAVLVLLGSLVLWADIYGFVKTPALDFGWTRFPAYGPNMLSRIEVPGSTIMAEAPSAERLGAYRQELMKNNNQMSIGKAEIEALRALGRGIDLAGRNLRRANLQEARMVGADLGWVQLQGANLVYAQLQDAVLFEAQLQDARLAGAQLQGANLGYAQLQDARLAGAKLQGVNLGGAQLQGADLGAAQLQDAYLGSAQLQGANLDDTKLQGADLGRAQLQGVDFERACGNKETKLPPGFTLAPCPE